MNIINGFNGTYCILDKSDKVIDVCKDKNELINYLKIQKQQKEQEIKLIQEHIRYFDAQK